MSYIVNDWLNENEARSYPLEQGSNFTSSLSYVLDEAVLLDLQLYSFTYPKSSNILLQTIAVSGSTVTFTLGGISIVIVDRTAITFPHYTPRDSNGNFIVVGKGILYIPNGTHTFTNLRVEPSLTFEFSNAWEGVNQIIVEPEFETIASSVLPTLPLVVESNPVVFTGDVNFQEGYQFGIYFNEDTNEINFRAGKSYGVPLDCSTEFIDPSLKDCGDIISYINGVPPDDSGVFRLITGQNVVLVDGKSRPNFVDDIDEDLGYTYPANPHTLFVELTFLKTDICAPVNTL